MCTAALGMAGQAFGAGASVVGAFASAKAQQTQLRSQARIAEINASISDAAAREELYASERQQEAIKLRGSQTKASEISAYAGNGIDVGVGTPVRVATGTDLVTEVDANTARANGILAAWGQRIQATGLRNQARSLRASASGISPALAGITTLLSSAGQVASSWYKMKQTGAFLGNGPNNFDIDAARRGGDEAVDYFTGRQKDWSMWG